MPSLCFGKKFCSSLLQISVVQFILPLQYPKFSTMKMTARINPAAKLASYLKQVFYTSLLLSFVALILYVLINSPA